MRESREINRMMTVITLALMLSCAIANLSWFGWLDLWDSIEIQRVQSPVIVQVILGATSVLRVAGGFMCFVSWI